MTCIDPIRQLHCLLSMKRSEFKLEKNPHYTDSYQILPEQLLLEKVMEDFNEKIVKWAHKIAGEQEFQAGYKVYVQRVQGTGYSSLNFRVTISEPNRELKMFAKIANIIEELRETSYKRLYADELYFYTDIVPVFREIEDRYEIPEEYRLSIPKFYGGDLIAREETIVLEDMSHRGFVCPDSRKPFNWEFAEKTIDQLARFHALSFMYRVTYPSEFSKILQSKRPHVFDSAVMRRLGFEQSLPVAMAAIGEGEFQQRLQRYLASTDRYAEMVQLYQTAMPRVLAHGDFKTNNLMQCHHVSRTPCLVVPVDFQNIHAGNPATDLLYLVMLGSDQDFRLEYLTHLRDDYYMKLTGALARMGVMAKDVYSRPKLEEDWRAALPIGLVVALMILPIIMPPKETGHASESPLGERLRGLVHDYIHWGIVE